jgi:lipopolysaccharide biosynthesis glycosyltransferase
MKLDIVVSTDDNYVQHLMGMLCSLYEHNKNHHIVLHMLRNGSLLQKNEDFLRGITEKYGHKIKFYNVDETPLQGVQFRKKRPLTMAAYYRLLLPDILPNLDKVLYLDCDMDVMGDVSELFVLELDDFALAACLDDMPHTNQHRLQLQMEVGERTFNTGMMMCNLKYWRENGCVPKLIEYAKRPKKEILLHDQDVFNYLFKKHWFLLPPKWNRLSHRSQCISYFGYQQFDRDEYLHHPMIVHHFIKPWFDVYKPGRNLYLKYVKMSGYEPIVLKHVTPNVRIKVWGTDFLYFFKRYINPYVPNIVYLFFSDLKFIAKFVLNLLIKRKITRRPDIFITRAE